MRFRIALIVMVLPLCALPAIAADDSKASAKPGPRAEEFRKIHAQMNTLLTKLLEQRIKYLTASAQQQQTIQLRWNDLMAEGRKLEPQMIAAAEKAYAEAPNADRQLTVFLVMLLDELVQADDYEPAARIGKLLMDNNCPEKPVANLAGIAAFAASDFDAAEKYLDTAAKQGFYHNAGNDKVAQIGLRCLGKVGYYKKAWAEEKKLRDREAKDDNLPRVLIKTSKGDIRLELFENEAPNTVANFISLIERGFYNRDMTFHQVTQGLAAQSGDPTGTGYGGPGYYIACECHAPNHPRKHFRGSLSMANAGQDTGGSQFFIAFTPLDHLDSRNTVFGRVIEGMDVLAKLQRRDPDDKEAPRADKILGIEVTRKYHEYKPQVLPE
jgi:cyclophilin family peptidyl-prolyl cis-trans isomerase